MLKMNNLIIIPIHALLEQKIDDFPQEITIELCHDINENVIITHNVPIQCTLISAISLTSLLTKQRQESIIMHQLV